MKPARAASGYTYVILNTAVSLLAFARNLLFMNAFDLAGVGQIALMQTIVMLIGFSQVGLVSGAFILWASGDTALNRRMADVLFFGKTALVLLAFAAAALFGSGMLAPLVAPETLAIGVIAGLATLASTWMNNSLVADQKLRRSNVVNLVAALVSVALALATLHRPTLTLALLSIAVQPLLVALGIALTDEIVRPRITLPDRDTLKRMFRVGIMPFLGSLSLLLTYQVERWSITGVMGSDSLGLYYIVILYLTFFQLVPVALMNIHFPRARRAIEAGTPALFHAAIRRHAIELGIYAAAALAMKLALLGIVLRTVLPNFQETEPLVYMAYGAGLFLLVQNMGTLVLYAVQDTRPILLAGLASLCVFCAAVLVLWGAGAFTLATVTGARILSAGAGAGLLMWGRHRALARLDREFAP